jgi:hypothetical protein
MYITKHGAGAHNSLFENNIIKTPVKREKSSQTLEYVRKCYLEYMNNIIIT